MKAGHFGTDLRVGVPCAFSGVSSFPWGEQRILKKKEIPEFKGSRDLEGKGVQLGPVCDQGA